MDADKKYILDKDELESADFPLNELFSLQVNHNNVKYEFLIRFSGNNKNLICFGSGSYDQKVISPPIYNRHSWQGEFEESVIYYNDPTLYIIPESPLKWNMPRLSLGWGVGKGDEWYLSVIAEIIGILSNNFSIKQEDILFFGSSGGGFTSIILSTLIKNSSVLVNNPQIFCKNLKDHFGNIRKACFNNLDSETILSQNGYRLNVIDLFKRKSYVPNLTYLVNVDSEVDLVDQFIPFISKLASMEEFNNQLKVILYRNENGHNGVIDKEDTIRLIKDHFKEESSEINLLKKELYAKEQRIIELQTIAGYMDYKVKNIIMRLKNRAKWVLMKIQKPYYELHMYIPNIDYNELTIVIPYRKPDDHDQKENLDITVRYLSSIGISNLIISEHSDVSTGDYFMKKYKDLFVSFKVIHIDAHGEVFNLAKARNNGIIHSTTPYIAISDLDCLTKKKNISMALGLLNRGYDVIHPFNRRVTDIVDKKSFIENYDFKTVETPEQERSTADGGIIFWNKHSFVSIGMFNEFFSGWGGEDNEIMFRTNLCGLKHYRIDDTLYHLYHYRPQKRTPKNVELEKKTRQMNNKNECLTEINKWPWVKEAKKMFSY